MSRIRTSAVTFSFTQAIANAFLVRGVGYVKRSPRIRSLALWMLKRMPYLTFRLRQMFIKSQVAVKWAYSQMHEDDTLEPNSNCSRPSGINDRQRSPLEKYYQTYVDRE